MKFQWQWLLILTWLTYLPLDRSGTLLRFSAISIPISATQTSPPSAYDLPKTSGDMVNFLKEQYRFLLLILAAILIVGGAITIVIKLMGDNDDNLGKNVVGKNVSLAKRRSTLANDPTPDISLPDQSINEEVNLAKINQVDRLITELQTPNSSERTKAIWELGQRGDSRAIQSLVNLFLEADSVEQSLILASLAEITTKTLKPINRTLMMALQDQKPEVRKNAIRDFFKIYELLISLTPLLERAVNDPDPEVREIAQWTLSQINRKI